MRMNTRGPVWPRHKWRQRNPRPPRHRPTPQHTPWWERDIYADRPHPDDPASLTWRDHRTRTRWENPRVN